MKRIIATTATLAAATGVANAAVNISQSTQGAVEASLASFTLEDFNVPDATFDPPPFADFNGFGVTADGTSGFPGDFAIVSGELSLFIDDGNIPSFTFDFDAPVDTLGSSYNFANPAPGFGLVFTFDNGEVIELNSDTVPGYTGGTEYIAIATDTTFTSVTISSAGGIDSFDMDNVVAGLVPAPGAFGLLGFAGLAAARRRR